MKDCGSDISLHGDPMDPVLLVRLQGQLSARCLRRLHTRILGQMRRTGISRALLDLTGVTTVAVTHTELETLAQQHPGPARTFPDVRLALVATDAKTLGVAHVYKRRFDRRSGEIRFFTDPIFARAWLAAPGP
jgi:hypothetical protein